MSTNQTVFRNDRASSVIPHSATSPEPRRVPVGANCQKEDFKVEIFREGDVVQAILITCSCGREIQLKCEY